MNKKEREFNCFSNFSQLFFGHEIVFEQPNPPEPDIVFTLDNKRIGCEISTIFIDNEPGQKDSAIRKSESIQEIICRNVRKWLTENIPGRFEIHLYFYNKFIPYSEINNVSNKIIQVVETYIPELNLEEFSRIMVQDYDKIPDELGYISISTSPRLKKTYVTRAGSSFIPKLNREKIISNVNHKEKLIEKYRHLTDSNWLLLTINESIFSSEFDFIEENYGNIETFFDKVFVFSSRDQKIVTIK